MATLVEKLVKGDEKQKTSGDSMSKNTGSS
jgi:hypothetical protein